jgi:hypothetical protein
MQQVLLLLASLVCANREEMNKPQWEGEAIRFWRSEESVVTSLPPSGRAAGLVS